MHLASEELARSCFGYDYPGARARFHLAAARAGARLDVFVNDVASGPDGGTLTTDVAVLGPANAERALLVVSGTHGPECLVGSAAQVALLDSLALASHPPRQRVVLVHAINPWGFAHLSRTTENNVDLNRNFIDWNGVVPSNPRYAQLHDCLCPPRWTDDAVRDANAARQGWIEQHGHDAFVDVTSRGQYTHADGLNYGGAGREWSNRSLEAIVARHLAGVAKVALIDWHTGLGEHGEPFFLCFNERSSPAWQRACDWWGRTRVESSGGFDGAGRPNYTGLLFHGVQNFAPHAELTGAVIEFGTLKPEDMRVALQMDRCLKFGDALSAPERASMYRYIFDAFSPSSKHWQRSTLGHAIGIQQATLAGLADWN